MMLITALCLVPSRLKPCWGECRVLPSCITPVPDMQNETQRRCWVFLPTSDHDMRLQGRDRQNIKCFCSSTFCSFCTCLSSLLTPPSAASQKPLPHSPFSLISSPSLPSLLLQCSQPCISSTEARPPRRREICWLRRESKRDPGHRRQLICLRVFKPLWGNALHGGIETRSYPRDKIK